jgi:hypothetical protein
VGVVSDATWDSDVSTRKSQTGYIVQYNDGLVASMSKLQKSVALSSAESELISLSSLTQEILWFRELRASITEDMALSPSQLFSDSKAITLSMLSDPCSFFE